jgi:two-component system sensor histidine kinase FlrB
MTTLDCPPATAERLPPDALLAALPAGLAIAAPDGSLRAVNAAARSLLATLVDPGLLATASGRLRLADGRELAIERSPLPGRQGDLLLITDRTDDRRLADVLARHQRLAALGELAATLAHQVRTPLAAALLYVGNAGLPGLDAAGRSGLLTRAAACLRDLEQLVDGMLGFARGAATGPRPTRLADVLATVALAAEPACRPGQQVSFAPAPGDAAVTVGREALAGAILNLVQNGLQAAGPAARVRVGATVTATTAVISVSDNGPGIPPGLRARVPEPFFTTRRDGTGLGLAVVAALARAAGGTLAIGAAAPTGALVSITLPLAGAPTVAAADAAP